MDGSNLRDYALSSTGADSKSIGGSPAPRHSAEYIDGLVGDALPDVSPDRIRALIAAADYAALLELCGEPEPRRMCDMARAAGADEARAFIAGEPS